MDEKEYQERLERMRAQVDALKNAPPIEKARTFLRKLCAGAQGLDEIREQIQHTLQFNSIPVWTGLEGLRAVLADPSMEPEFLVELVKQDGNQWKVPATPEAARAFLCELVDMLRHELGDEDREEGLLSFSPDSVVALPNAKGRIERLLCIDTLMLEDGQSYALLVPESAGSSGTGPYTVYRFWRSPDLHTTYELVKDEATLNKVIEAGRA